MESILEKVIRSLNWRKYFLGQISSGGGLVHFLKVAALPLLALKSSVATATRYSISVVTALPLLKKTVARYRPPLLVSNFIVLAFSNYVCLQYTFCNGGSLFYEVPLIHHHKIDYLKFLSEQPNEENIYQKFE